MRIIQFISTKSVLSFCVILITSLRNLELFILLCSCCVTIFETASCVAKYTENGGENPNCTLTASGQQVRYS